MKLIKLFASYDENLVHISKDDQYEYGESTQDEYGDPTPDHTYWSYDEEQGHQY